MGGCIYVICIHGDTLSYPVAYLKLTVSECEGHCGLQIGLLHCSEDGLGLDGSTAVEVAPNVEDPGVPQHNRAYT